MSFEWITNEMFDEQLELILDREGRNLLAVPGVYECVREHFNNEVIERLCHREGRDSNTGDPL